MDTQSALATVAEVGIGIAGFSTIAAAFASRGRPEDRVATWVKLRSLLTTSGAVVFLALLPMGVLGTGLDSATAWSVCSGAYIAWLLAARLRFSRDAEARQVDRMSRFVYGYVGFGSFFFQLYNVFAGTDWPYFFGLMIGLFIAFYHFFSLVRDLVRGEEAPVRNAA